MPSAQSLRLAASRAGLRVATAVAVVFATSMPALAANSPQGDVAAPWPVVWNEYRDAAGNAVYDLKGDQNPDNSDLASGTCTGTKCAGTSPTVFYASNGSTVFFRMRLAVDPADATKGGLAGNAYLTQIAVGTPPVVVAVVGVDGKDAAVDKVYVASAPGTTVTSIYEWPFTATSTGMRVVAAGGGQYFLDYQVPLARITAISGGAVTATTPVQLYYGSSAAANLATLNKDLMRGDVTAVDFTGLAPVSFSTGSLTTSRAAAHVSGPNPPRVGGTTRYTVTLTLTNPGGGAVSGTTATATLPPGVTYVSGSTGVAASGGTVTWTAGTLLPFAAPTATVTLDFTPTAGMVGTSPPIFGAISASGTDVGTGTARTASAPAITVGPVAAAAPPPNAAPVADDDSLTVAEDGSGTVNVLDGDTDADGGPLTVSNLSDPAHGTVTVSGGVVTYTPDANYAGPDSFTYDACDAAGACDTATVTVTVTPVNDAPADPADSGFSTPRDTEHTGTLPGSTDPDGDALTYELDTDAGHGDVTIDPDGGFTYTPDPGYEGPDSFTYSVCDPSGACATATVTVTVTEANDAPPAPADSSFSTPEDTPRSGTLPGSTDPEGDPLTFAVAGEPAHGELTVAADGGYTYTPDANYAGPDSFTYDVCDPFDACATATVTVTVTPVNDAPAPVADSSFTTPEDTPHTGTLPGTTDPDGDPLTFEAVGEPGHGELTVEPGGGYTYTPDANYAGPDSFTYRVCDPAGACSTATVTVTVSPVNDAPAAIADSAFGTPEDTPRTGTLPGSTDADGDALTYEVVTAPGHGTLALDPDGDHVYTPAADYHGPDSFAYRVCDPSGACAAATVTVTVTPLNDAPVAPADSSFTTPEDTERTGTLPAGTDVDGDALTYELDTDAGHGDIVIQPGGGYSYTPDADYTGPDSFTYRVCDPSDACDTATVNVTVTPVNDAPAPVADSAVSTPEDTPRTGTLPGSTDADGDALAYEAVTQPEHGELTVEPGGGYTYTPDENYAGPDSFAYRVCDPSGACATATVTVTVTPVNDAPGPVADSAFSTPEDTPRTGTLPGTTDADGDALTFEAGTQPAHGELTVEPDGGYTYTPDADYSGPDSFTYSVCDPSDACSTATVTVTVTPANDGPPSPADSAFSTPEDTPRTGTLPGSADPDGDPLTYELVTGAAHGDVTVGPDGGYTYTPAPNYTGPDSFTYRLCDDGDACAGATVTVTVTPVNDGPAPVADSAFGTPEDTARTGALPGTTDPDGDALTYEAGTQPGHGELTVEPDGGYTYTPDAGYHGPDSFTYRVCDPSGACATATVTVTVTPVNDAPPAPADTAVSTPEDTPRTGTLPGVTDPDGDPLTYGATAQPAHGDLTVTADGGYTYTPDADYSGPDSFGFQVCDPSGACAGATVTVTVTPVNDAPVAVDDVYTTPYGTPVVLDLAANDTDPDGDDLAAAPSTPLHGTLSAVGGVVTYTPNTGWSGTDSFAYTSCDAGELCDTGLVTVTVQAAQATNSAPVADAGTNRSAVAGSTVTLDGSGSADPDLDLLTYAWTQIAGPTVTLTGATSAKPSFTAPAGPGALVFQLAVSDGELADTDTVTVTTEKAVVDHAPPSCDDVTVTTGPGGVAVTVPCKDAGGTPGTVVGEPGHGRVEVRSDGTFRYVPDAGYSGADRFTVRVCNAHHCTEAVVDVTVRARASAAPFRNPRLPRTGTGLDTLVPIGVALVVAGAALQRRRRTASDGV